MKNLARQLALVFVFTIIIYFLLALLGGIQTYQKLKATQMALKELELEKARQYSNQASQAAKTTFFLLSILPNKGVFREIKKLLVFTQEGAETINEALFLAQEGKSLGESVLHNKPEKFIKEFPKWENQARKLISQGEKLEKDLEKMKTNTLVRRLGQQEKLENVQKQISQINKEVNQLEKLFPFIPSLLGVEKEKRYLVLLQNNMELRPTGGFMGSYALITFHQGTMTNLEIEDIYVPDGQIPGHVNPPAPIQEAFKQGWWRLRDANWDPNFPQGAKVIKWFFQKGGVRNIDGLVAINLTLATQILEKLGPVRLIDYNEEVSSENIYRLAQYYAESDFFPGSTQKRDFLSALGRAIVEKIKQANTKDYLNLAKIFLTNLQNKEILINLDDPKIQEVIQKLGWDGSLEKTVCPRETPCVSDDLAIIEANLGANKANCCVGRQTLHTITLDGKGRLIHTIVFTLENHNKTRRPLPPKYWGGEYNNYLRFYLPLSAKIITIMVNNLPVPSKKITIKPNGKTGLKAVGFFLNIPPLEKSTVEIAYSLAETIREKAVYQLVLHKQPGIRQSPQTIIFSLPRGWKTLVAQQEALRENSLIIKENLTKDLFYSFLIYPP